VGAEPLVATPGRLDAVVAALTGASRVDVQRAIAGGRVLVDGAARPRSFRLAGGERLDVALTDRPAVLPEGPPVPVRFRDDDLLVVAKPAGPPTHPTAARPSGSLVNRLLGMGVPLAAGDDPWRPGIVHRLDAGTSGLLVVASSEAAAEALRAMFRRHEVSRTYLALVRGRPAHATFDVEAPLGRRRARTVVAPEGGRHAETSFAIRASGEDATLLEARPRTGRTHQIRAHLAAIGHPILGDRAYGGGGVPARRLGLDRPFLHAWRIGFDHPVTGERIELEEPLPEDLERALRAIGATEGPPDLAP